MENRIKAALEFLKDGQCFTVGDLRLGIDSNNYLVVSPPAFVSSRMQISISFNSLPLIKPVLRGVSVTYLEVRI